MNFVYSVDTINVNVIFNVFNKNLTYRYTYGTTFGRIADIFKRI